MTGALQLAGRTRGCAVAVAQEAGGGNSAASRLAQEAAATTLLGPWRQGAPVGRAGRARGAHLQLTLPPGRSQVLDLDLDLFRCCLRQHSFLAAAVRGAVDPSLLALPLTSGKLCTQAGYV